MIFAQRPHENELRDGPKSGISSGNVSPKSLFCDFKEKIESRIECHYFYKGSDFRTAPGAQKSENGTTFPEEIPLF